MKRVLAVLLALCLLPALGMAQAKVSAPGVYPIVEEPVELKIWITQTSQTGDIAELVQTKWYEEFSGVKVNWVVSSNEEMETKFNLAIASGDYPDIFLYLVDSGELLNLVQDGVVIPLNDLIEEHGYYTKQAIEELGIRDAITAPDGNIYSLFSSVALVQNSMYNKLWVLRPWLDAYCAATGGRAPETTEEFFNMLVYFRDHDMNGNGDAADEVPLKGTFSRWAQGSDPLFYFMNAFTYCPNDFLVVDENHQVSLAAATDEFREGLRYMNRLYEEKLLSEETYVQSLVQLRTSTSVSDANATVGVVAGMNPMRIVNLSTDPAMVSYDDYMPIPPVAGPEGVRIAPRRAENELTLRCFITTKCQHPEVAMKWLDYWLGKEGSLWSSFHGQENVHWKWVDEVSFAGDPRSVTSLVQWASPQNVYWTIEWFANYYITRDMFTSKSAASTYTDNELAGNLAEQAYLPYARMTNFPQIAWCADPALVTEKAELDTLFQNYIISACTQFVMGALDIDDDAAWDGYLKELDNMGLARYLEVVRLYNFGK